MDAEGGRESQIPYEELAEIDLDALGDLDGEGLAEHFRNLAARASEGQLREVLGYGPDTDADDLAALAETYVRRRLMTIAKMRTLLTNP